jgi:hypothetical protein
MKREHAEQLVEAALEVLGKKPKKRFVTLQEQKDEKLDPHDVIDVAHYIADVCYDETIRKILAEERIKRNEEGSNAFYEAIYKWFDKAYPGKRYYVTE